MVSSRPLHCSHACQSSRPTLPRNPVSARNQVMAGCFFMRPCTTNPVNCDLLKATGLHQRSHPDKHDQYSFNSVLATSPVNYSLLDPLLFVNGALFFSDRAPQMLGIRPVIVQNNHIVGVHSKMHRFRYAPCAASRHYRSSFPPFSHLHSLECVLSSTPATG